MRVLVVLGVVLSLLWSGVSLGGDTPALPVPEKTRNPLESGQLAPAFSAHDPTGQTIALQDYQGHPVIINFWATWCAPCRQEMQAFQAVYDVHKAAGLVILAISQDQQDRAEAVRAYWAAAGLTFLPLLDPEGNIATPYNVFLLPSTVFVHPAGTVAAVHLGPMTQEQIEKHLKTILPQPG